MTENHEFVAVNLLTPVEHHPVQGPVEAPVEPPVAEAPVSETGPSSESHGWHAEAGRKGAYRIRELIRYGKLYEQEHGLKSGRQRLRQLIEEGKLYEQEHGLRPAPKSNGRSRGPRLSKQELLGNLLQSLVRLARPGLRAELTRLLEQLDRSPVQN